MWPLLALSAAILFIVTRDVDTTPASNSLPTRGLPPSPGVLGPITSSLVDGHNYVLTLDADGLQTAADIAKALSGSEVFGVMAPPTEVIESDAVTPPPPTTFRWRVAVQHRGSTSLPASLGSLFRLQYAQDMFGRH